ncbi:hydantoinase/oxoprolinase N-terminal domain-containing protein [Bacillus norwichensis]|uniref:Hydantoinase/oxoprolinase family protein n=1 Tax=Bacillus norwichensis TaxID=2762217 RepID=A0ABR8VKQ8_9BACI|nr:hydantoinase/oxoprolinase family protein [Bacillus norwichensis]MBD8005352.1 hydantoinase/oxoprolinase family protein [Bacillus norwichensis]
MIRLGIDVGGTNTDGVILDHDNQVIGSTKSATTKDVFTGIQQSIKKLLTETSVDVADIQVATLGTTHCTNAIVERKSLDKVGIVRICLPSGSTVPPMLGWPEDLVAKVQAESVLIHGGYEYNGSPIADLDYTELKKTAELFRGKVDSIAISGVFSPVLSDQEKEVAAFFEKELPGIPVSLSSEIGTIGLIERENATILNAALMTVINRVAQDFERALKDEGINAHIYLGQNDGTLMTNSYAQKYPIYTIACGPTNSIRGAAHLSQEPDAIVVDIGGTTTDIGVLANSFPRQTSIAVEVGGVRTNYRMPDIYSIGFGGGTRVYLDENSWKIGPESVGYQLTEKAIVFGGEELTATDVAIGAGFMEIEGTDPTRLNEVPCSDIYRDFITMVENAIDRMKTSAEDLPVVLVGGGAALMPESLKGASRVIRPEHASVANAIGAALGDISGTVERIYSLEEQDYQKVIKEARNEAIQEAIDAGADPEKVDIIQLEDFPLAYMPGNAILVRVKAAGPLAL